MTLAAATRLLVPVVSVIAACGTSRPFVADNLYDEAPPRAPIAADAARVFARPPWELRSSPAGIVRVNHEAGLALPDSAESFRLSEVFVYAADGSDVQLEYVSAMGDQAPRSRVVIRVSVYRAPSDLDAEWKRFERRWHEKQAGALAEPWPLPDGYPAETRQMAFTLPVGDSYDGPAFEQIVLFHSAGFSVRYRIACAAEARNDAAARARAFLRWIRAEASAPQPGSLSG